MSEPSPDQPYILWALGLATTALYGLVYHIFNSIRQTRTETVDTADGVRAELLRAQAAADAKLEVMRTEWLERWREAREDRDLLRSEMREYHQTDLRQHDEIRRAVDEMPERIVRLLGEQRRA